MQWYIHPISTSYAQECRTRQKMHPLCTHTNLKPRLTTKGKACTPTLRPGRGTELSFSLREHTQGLLYPTCDIQQHTHATCASDQDRNTVPTSYSFHHHKNKGGEEKSIVAKACAYSWVYTHESVSLQVSAETIIDTKTTAILQIYKCMCLRPITEPRHVRRLANIYVDCWHLYPQ